MPQRLKVVVLAMLDMATMVHYTEAALRRRLELS
jgi:hypothetical protein